MRTTALQRVALAALLLLPAAPAVMAADSEAGANAAAPARDGWDDDRVVPWLRRKLDPAVPDEGPPAAIRPAPPASSPDGRTVPWPRQQRQYQMPP